MKMVPHATKNTHTLTYIIIIIIMI